MEGSAPDRGRPELEKGKPDEGTPVPDNPVGRSVEAGTKPDGTLDPDGTYVLRPFEFVKGTYAYGAGPVGYGTNSVKVGFVLVRTGADVGAVPVKMRDVRDPEDNKVLATT